MVLPAARSALGSAAAGLVGLIVSGVAVSACVDPGTSDLGPATGGSAPGVGGSSGGAPPGSGGAVGSGGAIGSGGVAASGGAIGSGGALGSGGISSSGGASGSGGSSGGGGGSGGSGTGGAPPSCPTVQPLTGGPEYCSNGKGSAGSGYGYELWAEGPGTGCMTVHGVEAAFSAEWDNVEDFLARVGLDFNQTQTHQEIGTISAEFAETKTDDGGLTYIGIYGWTVNPLREFYILDDWGSEKPGGIASDGTPRDEVGTLEADGETYDVWKKTRVDKPAITGDSETFDQYFSIRRTARQCGIISVSEHFEQWEELGLQLGDFHEVKLLLEAQFNGGSINFTTARVVVE